MVPPLQGSEGRTGSRVWSPARGKTCTDRKDGVGAVKKDELAQKVIRAQGGDRELREQLLEKYRPFITSAAAGYCRRSLDWANDEELSVSLLAFNEAIDTFRPGTGATFLTYAGLVIRRRLCDFFRKERRAPVLLSEPQPGEGSVLDTWERAWEQYRQEEQVRERREEIQQYRQELEFYGLTLEEVVRVCPRHRDSRERLQQAALALARDPFLSRRFREQKRVPLQELSRRTGLGRKLLERGRKYIVAVVLVLLHPHEFPYLHGYLELPLKEGKQE